jgi:hypothetical protein
VREHEIPVISRALQPHPGSRWPSCRAFVAALRQAMQTKTRDSGPGSTEELETLRRRTAWPTLPADERLPVRRRHLAGERT